MNLAVIEPAHIKLITIDSSHHPSLENIINGQNALLCNQQLFVFEGYSIHNLQFSCRYIAAILKLFAFCGMIFVHIVTHINVMMGDIAIAVGLLKLSKFPLLNFFT